MLSSRFWGRQDASTDLECLSSWGLQVHLVSVKRQQTSRASEVCYKQLNYLRANHLKGSLLLPVSEKLGGTIARKQIPVNNIILNATLLK